MSAIVLIATLDTKGREVAYLREALTSRGVDSIVIDTGILGEPVGITPDISHADLAARGGLTLEQLQSSGTRGRAVATMRELVIEQVQELFTAGAIVGGMSIGGVGSVMGAAALQTLPLGYPKIVVAPTASGHHEFDPYVGTKDVLVLHSVADISGLNPILCSVLDNAAAAMAGMCQARVWEQLEAERDRKDRPVRVGMTMLGNTTTAGDAVRERLAQAGIETVVFHSNGIGGPAMEEAAEAGLLDAVIDYTTNEITDPLVGGIHHGGPERLARIGRLGLPQVFVPGCVDFSVFASGNIPAELQERPIYDHNPEYHLVRMTAAEMRQIGQVFAQRINESIGPVKVLVPTQGLSIPNTPTGIFWNPDADAGFLAEVRTGLRPDIELTTLDLHINDPAMGVYAAETLLGMFAERATSESN